MAIVRQLCDCAVEVYRIHNFGMCYTHDLLDVIMEQSQKLQSFCTVKALFVNVKANKCIPKLLSFDLSGSWFDNLMTNMQLAYELACNELNIQPQNY